MEDEKISNPPNLRSIKPPPRNVGSRITKVIYDAMVETYIHGDRTVNGLARAHGVVYKTALKAIEEGWPRNGWAPLKERAAFYDKLHEAAAAKESPARAKEARDFLVMREEYMKISHGVRSGLAQCLGKLIPLIPTSSPDQVMKISISLARISSALERTGGGELEQLSAKLPTAATGGRRKHNLTIEQLQFMAENRGQLPPGVKLEDLGG